VIASLGVSKTPSRRSPTPHPSPPPSLTLVNNSILWPCLSLFNSGGITFPFWKWAIVPFPSVLSSALGPLPPGLPKTPFPGLISCWSTRGIFRVGANNGDDGRGPHCVPPYRPDDCCPISPIPTQNYTVFDSDAFPLAVFPLHSCTIWPGAKRFGLSPPLFSRTLHPEGAL
jgi:hypothetical protein